MYSNCLVGGDRIMKLMVQSWIRDVTTYQNVFADQQIMHFYRSEKKSVYFFILGTFFYFLCVINVTSVVVFTPMVCDIISCSIC